MVEREKKWLVKPRTGFALPIQKHLRITQGYAEMGDPEVRVREVQTDWNKSRGFLTTKWGSGEVREEHEVEIPLATVTALLRMTENKVYKDRYELPGGFELDVFDGPLRGLSLLELEYDEESLVGTRFPRSVEVVQDVTEDPLFKNKYLAALEEETGRYFIGKAYDLLNWSNDRPLEELIVEARKRR